MLQRLFIILLVLSCLSNTELPAFSAEVEPGEKACDVSLRHLKISTEKRIFSLNESYMDISYEKVVFSNLRVETMLLKNQGYKGIIFPVPSTFVFSLPVPEQGMLKFELGLHRGDWMESRNIGMPTLTLTADTDHDSETLFRFDFSQPGIRFNPEWISVAVPFRGTPNGRVKFTLKLNAGSNRRRQARVCIANFFVYSHETKTMNLEPDPVKWLIPQAFTAGVPGGMDGCELFRELARMKRLLQRVKNDLSLPDRADLIEWVLSLLETRRVQFSNDYGSDIFQALWRSIPVAGSEKESPNILLILIDCLRRDHVSCYGYSRQTTPIIDEEIALPGYIFAEAYSTGSSTDYSMPSLMTSHYPTRHRFHAAMKLPDGENTLAEYLQSKGYLTMGITTNPYLGYESGMDRGYGIYDILNDFYTPYPKAVAVVDRALDLMKGFKWAPGFLYVHFMDAHGYYRPPPPFDSCFDGQSYSSKDENLNDRMTPPFKNNPTFRLPEEKRSDYVQVERIKTLYDGEIRYADTHIGRLFEYLQQERLFDDTIILVLADHGEEFLEHGFSYHNGIPHEEKIRIPFLLKPQSGFKGEMPGRIEGKIDGVLNTFPTLVDLAGLPVPEGLHGRTLVPMLRKDSPPVAEYLFNDNEKMRAVHSGPWKYITSPLNKSELMKIPEIHLMGDFEDMLFNLEIDPGERQNLLHSSKEHAEQLKMVLNRKFAEIIESHRSGHPPAEDPPDGKLEERLRALGYLE